MSLNYLSQVQHKKLVCVVKRLKHFPFIGHSGWELSPYKQNQQWDCKDSLYKGFPVCPQMQGTIEGSELSPDVLGNTGLVQAGTGEG